MSFRARLTTFFLLIVVIPMATVGFLVFRLIDDSQQGKADARVNGIASTAASVYEQASRAASLEARTVAPALERTSGRALRVRVEALATRAGIARLAVTIGGAPAADTGAPTAVAPGIAIVRQSGSLSTRAIVLSQLTATQYAAEVAGRGTQVVVAQGGHTLATTLPAAPGRALSRSGRVKLGDSTYQAQTLSFTGFGASPVKVTVLSGVSPAGGSVSTDRLIAALFILGFVILALWFALLASKAFQDQLAHFLRAARRLGAGDFSAPIETKGNDEFAALGAEFNSMSMQLASRLEELKHEQARLRRSIRNIGAVFASNLDRAGLLGLALETAIDAADADCGRLIARERAGDPLTEAEHVGDLERFEQPIAESEQMALEANTIGQASTWTAHVATVPLGPIAPGGPTHGLITVAREGRSFSEDDLELLRSLASRATLALANVNLHRDIQHQAITDDLTELATHGHFQNLLAAEMDEVLRYGYPVGLVMMDIDDFKSINDLYGHQQGDVVLRHVAKVLHAGSRDVDVAARYGGEELALILPHTNLEGTYAIAERVREAVEGMRIPLLDREGTLLVTASFGVAASAEGDKDELIAAADNALYVAKREGKNRTVKARPQTVDVLGGR